MSSLTHGRLRDPLRDPLRESVDILRRAVKPFNEVNCLVILGLLILKRLSDRFEENLHDRSARANALDTSGSGVLRVPEEARWAKIQGLSRNLIDGLNFATSALCRANPSLASTLAGINFTSVSHVFGGPQQTDRLLHEVISCLSQLHLSNASLPEPDMLGRACDELIEKVAEVAGNKNPGVSVPPSLSRLLVKLLDPEEGHLVCDPACGLGSNLIFSAQHVAEKSRKRFGVDDIDLTLHGQEANSDAWAICRLKFLLHDIRNPQIENGDIIAEPKLVKDGKLLCYDRVFMVPPFGYKVRDRNLLERDAYGRFHDRQSVRGESAFVQHAVKSLAANGCAGVVVPHGALFRGSSDVTLRQELVDQDLFEAVIGLPSNLFFGTSMSVVILILNRNKRLSRRGNVLFVDASKDYESHPGKNVLRSQDIARIVEAFQDWRDDGDYSRVVSNSAIKLSDFDMSIARHVARLEYQESTDDDIAKLLVALVETERIRDVAAAHMDALLENLGHGRPNLKR